MFKKQIKYFLSLILCLMLSQPLYGQEASDAFAAQWFQELLYEQHDVLFNLAALSLDHGITAIHNPSLNETTAKGWAFDNFRLNFGVGFKFVLPLVEVEDAFNAYNKTFNIPNLTAFGEVNTAAVALHEETSSSGLSITRFMPYIPYFTLSLGRLGLNRRSNLLDQLLFTFQYGGSISAFDSIDESTGQSLELGFSQNINLFNISVQYAFHEGEILHFQLLSGFSYSRTRFQGQFTEFNTNDTFEIPASVIPADSRLEDPDATYSIGTFNANENGPFSVTQLRHTISLFHIGFKGEVRMKLLSIFFSPKLAITLHNNYIGRSELNYLIFKGNEILLSVSEIRPHSYTANNVIATSFLTGVTFFKVISFTIDTGIFQGSAFLGYLGLNLSINVAL